MQAVILAAGESSRFWPFNQKHKSLVNIMGRPLISYTIDGLRKVGIKDIIVVEGPKREIEKELKEYGKGIRYVVQPRAKGTGNAIWQAKDLIRGDFMVLGSHKVDIGGYLPGILAKYKKKMVIVGTKTNSPWDYGILKFKGKKIAGIVENPKKGKEPSKIEATETYLLPGNFFDYYKRVSETEESLIEAINLLIEKEGADLFLLKKETISLKYPWHLFSVLKFFLESNNFKKYVSPSARIGKNVVINGKVFIGKNVIIGDNTVISGPCYIADGCKIGLSNVLRGPLSLEKNVVTGAFMEIKNSLVGEDTHFHSGYCGDSLIGKECRFGAGFISANRRIDRNNINSAVKGKEIDTGLTYLGVIAGEKSRFGIQTGIMPGILIGSNCTIGPGSLVFENIEDNTIFYTEFKGIKRINNDKS